jgi:hypothetical protein
MSTMAIKAFRHMLFSWADIDLLVDIRRKVISNDWRIGHFVIQRYGNRTLLLEKPFVILR